VCTVWYMRYETSTTTAAEPSRLWAVLSDVESWPEWIDVYEEVRRAKAGELAIGDSVHVKQKGLAAGDWTVTELDEGRSFVWESHQPGVRIVGRHSVEADADGGSRLTLQLEMSGWMSGLVGMLLGRKSRAYVDLECARLATVAAEPTPA
jgi:ribosome-associated toxin RatA of RatAB toxin-antitoxin module